MKTLFKSFIYECSSYDITQGDNEAAQWVREKLAECREKANDYISKKDRIKYYTLSGTSTVDEPDVIEGQSIWIPVAYTDEELQRISTLIIDCYNKDVDDKIPYDTDIFGLCSDMPLHETKGFSAELDELIHEKAEEYDLEPCALSFEPHYNYRFMVFYYNRDTGELLSKQGFDVPLADEEYLELLSQRLLLGKQFNYNRLVLTHPHLAQCLTERMLTWSFHEMNGEYQYPTFIIHFTEIEEDAKAIETNPQ
jgi:hypothetical protein